MTIHEASIMALMAEPEKLGVSHLRKLHILGRQLDALTESYQAVSQCVSHRTLPTRSSELRV